MKFCKVSIVLFFCLISSSVFSQTNQQEEIKKVITHFFDGMHANDTIKIKESTGSNVIMQTIGISENGKYELKMASFNGFLKNIAAINPETTKIEEKIVSFDIKVDGNMAHVWTPYEFYLNKEFSHCGVNSFQLFNNGTVWKIIYIIDTRRKQNCIK